MTRRALLLAILSPTLAFGEPQGFSVRGKLTATDQEAQEGYFQLGRELMIATPPKSPIVDGLRQMVGRDVVFVLEAR